jgi:hypothetical protein
MQEEFSGFGYVLMTNSKAPTSAQTNFGDAWHQKYFDERFHEIDPIFEFNRNCGARSGYKILTTNEMANPLFEEAKPFGANSNFISISAYGGSRMIFGGVNSDLDAHSASVLHQSCKSAHRTMLVKNVDKLSDAQIDFMEMSEEGLADKQIAHDLGISLSAVAQRKKVICDRVGTTKFGAALSLYSMRKWGGIVPLNERQM